MRIEYALVCLPVLVMAYVLHRTWRRQTLLGILAINLATHATIAGIGIAFLYAR